MEPVPKNNASDGDDSRAEENNDSWELKGVQNIIVAEGPGLGSSEDDETRINEAAEEINNGPEGVIQVSSGPQQLPFQGPVVHWDRFLPIRLLKVLLVENDDSTRHVVSALLRNCGYEVTAVSNGFQAWKILVDFNNHTDLVLTEVVMPHLSGVGLLCKIMSHKTFKNIPVIMMSSHDSMGLVFKCLSKGAVDFLVKPIRKNELKNLWQHVWRRCHSSSGSGSESGTQTKNSTKSKSNDEFENHSGSSDEHDNGSIGLSIRDGSDNGSGTQSSWTKMAAEVDSPQPISPSNQLADSPGSTCAQVIHIKPETSITRRIHVAQPKWYQERDELAMGKDLEIGTSRDPDSQLEYLHKFSNQPCSKSHNKLSEPGYLSVKKEKQELKTENISGKVRDHAENLSKVFGICIEPQAESRALEEAPSGFSDVSKVKGKGRSDFNESSSLELTLKNLREVGDVGTSVHGDQNVLKHSNQSAFSKYNASFSTSQAPTRNLGSSSPLDNSSVADQQVIPGKVDDVAVGTDEVQERGSNRQVQVEHHHHHYHHHHHHVHNMQHQPHQDHDDFSLKNLAAAAPQCGSTNMLGGSVEGNVGTCSMNGSASGSNYGRNGMHGSGNALHAGMTKMENDGGAAGKNGVVVSWRVGGNGADGDRLALREAALTKFRQKRKERCFEKKVRCEGRKRMADQRPRIRGQFVPHIVFDTKAGKDRQDCIAHEDNSSDSIQ